MNIAETARLRLRHLELPDAAFYCRLLNEPSWLANIGDRGVRTVADAEQYLRTKSIPLYETLGYGMYLVETRDERRPIGLCGLVKRDALPDPDLGFALLPEFWGKGYAHEASLAVMNHARDVLGIRRLFAIVTPANERSIALLEGLGFTHHGAFRLTPQDQELKLYVREAL